MDKNKIEELVCKNHLVFLKFGKSSGMHIFATEFQVTEERTTIMTEEFYNIISLLNSDIKSIEIKKIGTFSTGNYEIIISIG